MSQEEIANIFIQTMQAHADARPYDWVMFYVGIFGIIASLLVAYFAYRLNKKQIAIAERQSKISEEQTEIAKKQAEVMEQQNKIQLLRDRIHYWNVYSLLSINAIIAKNNVETWIEEKKSYLEIRTLGNCSLLLDIIEFNDDDKLARHDYLSYSILKFKKLIEEVGTICFLFTLSESQEKEFSHLLNLLIDVLTSGKTEDSLSDNSKIKLFLEKLSRLNEFFVNSNLNESLKEQIFISRKEVR